MPKRFSARLRSKQLSPQLRPLSSTVRLKAVKNRLRSQQMNGNPTIGEEKKLKHFARKFQFGSVKILKKC